MPSTPLRRLAALLACLAAWQAPSARAADRPAIDPQEAQYLRWHDSALAFSEAVGRLAPRYEALRRLDMNQVRQIIAESEQAARRNDFESAGYHARRAYEIERAAIAAAVGGAGTTLPH